MLSRDFRIFAFRNGDANFLVRKLNNIRLPVQTVLRRGWSGFNRRKATRSNLELTVGKYGPSLRRLPHVDNREEYVMVAIRKFGHPEFRKKVIDGILEMLTHLPEAFLREPNSDGDR